MDTVILAGGYAKRLWPLTRHRAKPLLPVGGRPMISYLIDQLKQVSQLRKIWIVTNDRFFGDFQVFLTASDLSHTVGLLNDGTRDEAHRLGAIQDIQFAIRKARIRQDLLVIGGDNLSTFDLRPFMRFALRHRPAVTVGVWDLGSKAKVARRYGICQLNRRHQVVGFQEKPAQPKDTRVALCLYWFDRPVFRLIQQYLKAGCSPDAPGHLIAWLVDHAKVYGYQFRHGLWYDIGTLATLRRANKEFHP